MPRRFRRKSRDEGGLIDELLGLAVASPLAGFIAAGALVAVGVLLPSFVPPRGQVIAGLGQILLLILGAVTALFAAGTLVFRGLKRGTDALAKTVFSRPRPVTLRSGPSMSHPRGVATLLSRGENAFYVPLMEAVAGRCVVQVKVRLADLLTFPDDPTDKKRWLNLTANQHVDFVLCEMGTMAPRLVIELDDRSHQRPDRQRRDAIVDEVLNNAGLPIAHIKCQPAYDVQSLKELVSRHLSPTPATQTLPG